MLRKISGVILFLAIVFAGSSTALSYTDEEQYIYDKLYLQLPWKASGKIKLTQKNKDTPTHLVGSVDEYALDFGFAENTPVTAAASGVAYVYKEGHTKASAYGNHIKIDHGYFYTLYAHLSSINDEIDGYEVRKGDVIGLSGNTGYHAGSGKGYHLHFGLYHGYAWEDGFKYSVKSKIVIANEGAGPYQVLESTQFNNGQFYLSGNFEFGKEGIIVCGTDGCYVNITSGVGGNPGTLPDFIVTRIWLETPWGAEAYRYGSPEIMKMGARFENIGTGDPNETMEVHFYLSKGYKEDPHSGDGAWTRVGTDYIQPENLKAGMTHTETEGIELWRDIPGPGIWNITAYVDHIADNHNNGGAIAEEYESNNGSTEAVFEVTADGKIVNVPSIDFITSGLNFRGTPPYYAGDQVHFGAWVINQGTVRSPADIRSSYSLLCPNGSSIYLTDDGTAASTLSPGALAFEENLGAINLPNVPGNYTAYFCADYQNAVQETNETNNCTSFSFVLQPRPKPNLIITKFQDEAGCCTTNTGSRIKPNVWVKNTGPVAPVANIIVLYQIRSPIATGNQWWNIGYSIIEPRELPPGGTDEDYMEGGGWTIPSNSAWKYQWHEIRACIRSDGSYPTGDPNKGDNCVSYVRYSKK